ncbi:maleylpyruvate isomerase N-terminal domain-containing protein [Micromonospora sp. WMMD882]|uniref:maleylpyruvate isomerase N-terminal domain-containing protein n=1 Tax=Micromonospora sp. WMMD882 TaxID=3015151 RepID=UPI00248B916C|nr:maleylpyruvate isomerase N-terminal domain-containing protein [Micromonospora sp. WMMD882]WBB80596.1 maleylpyruvate isomerase N-terminal domain-containing protein [Micromonospora sp. WMMD882]
MRDQAGQERWRQVRAAARRSAAAFVELVQAPGAARVLVTAEWTVADTAAHLLSIATHYVSVLDADAEPLPVPDLGGLLAATTVDTLSEANRVVLGHLPERDPAALARSLTAAVDRFLALSRQADPERVVPWLGQSLVTVAGIHAHLVNELLVHGWDVARALGRPWRLPDEEAALFLELFLLGMFRRDHGVLLETGARTSSRPITVEFRSAHTTAVRLVLTGRRVRVAVDDPPVDARVTFRPAGLNLMLFGRVGLLRSLLRRDVVLGGPRPWLLPAFLRVVHLPRN